MKKALSLILALAMLVGMLPAVLAVDEAELQQVPDVLAATQLTEPIVEVGTSAELVAAIAAGGSVRLTADIVQTAKATVSGPCVLDLAGKKISFEGSSKRDSCFYNPAGSVFTIIDSVGSGTVTVTNSDTTSLHCIFNNGTLILEGGTFKTNVTNAGAYGVKSKGGTSSLVIGAATIEASISEVQYDGNGKGKNNSFAVNVMGGTCTINEGAVITGSASVSRESYALYVNDAGSSVTINGGTFNGKNTSTSAGHAVGVNAGTVVIEDGTFTSSSTGSNTYTVRTAGDGANVTIKGGTFTATTATNKRLARATKGNLKIQGGVFKSDSTPCTDSCFDITGGQFVTENAKAAQAIYAYLSDDYAQLDNGTVVPAEEVPDRMSVDGVAYKSVHEAVSKIKADGTSELKLLCDVDALLLITSKYPCTVDLNRHTLTSGSGVVWEVSASVTADSKNDVTTFKNGTIVGASSAVNWRKGALAVDGCTFVGKVGMCVQVLNYGDTAAADYADKNVIKNSTLYTVYDRVMAFNSSGADFSKSKIRIENSDLVAGKTSKSTGSVFQNRGKASCAGTIELGTDVNLYTYRTGYITTHESYPKPNVVGLELTKVGENTHSYVANGTQLTGLNKWATATAVAEIDGTGYATVEAALAAAEAGQTVTLLKDVETTDALNIPDNATLDLGGKTLTAAGLNAFGTLKDTGAAVEGKKTGLLKVAADQLTVGEATSQLALYDADAEGFRFFTAAVEALGNKADGENALKFGFRITFPEANAQASDLLAANVAVKCDLSWTGETGKTVTYSFEKAIVEKYADGIKTEPKFAFIFRVGGLNTLEAGDELTVAPQFTTLRDQTVAVAAMTYTVAAGN